MTHILHDTGLYTLDLDLVEWCDSSINTDYVLRVYSISFLLQKQIAVCVYGYTRIIRQALWIGMTKHLGKKLWKWKKKTFKEKCTMKNFLH